MTTILQKNPADAQMSLREKVIVGGALLLLLCLGAFGMSWLTAWSGRTLGAKWGDLAAASSDLQEASPCAKKRLAAKLTDKKLVTKRDLYEAEDACYGSERDAQLRAVTAAHSGNAK